MEEQNKLTPFEGSGIRKIWHNDQWFFSVIDIIERLTDSKDPKQYWKRLNQRDKELKGAVQIVPLLFETEGGKQKILCASTEGVLRIVQSVPSPKAEPIRLWLAKVGAEHIEETENPELAFDRVRDIYKAKGYPDDWIGYREKSILIRKELTDQWQKRGVEESKEYAMLTSEIAKGTFGVTPTEHKQIKGLDKENLRDHMTNFELILTALSEEATRFIAVRDDAQGFHQNHEAAVQAGAIGGKARRNLEQDLKMTVVSPQNFLDLHKNDGELPENANNTPPQ
jgi:DNA-damage-inducible protein D